MRRSVSLAVLLLFVFAIGLPSVADDKAPPPKAKGDDKAKVDEEKAPPAKDKGKVDEEKAPPAKDKGKVDDKAPPAKEKDKEKPRVDDKAPPKAKVDEEKPLAPAREKPKVKLAVGENITATFHPYNVTASAAVKEEPDEDDKDAKKKDKIKKPAYTTKGKFHCLITEYDLDPVVMLFARGNLEDNAGFRDLLQKIDGAIDRNPGVRLRCFVVFVADDIEDVVKDDDKREEAAKKIQKKLADDLKLRQVVLTLASKADVSSYPLDPGMAVTAVLYQNLRIAAVHPVPLDKLDKADAEAVKAIMKDVAEKLKAAR
jgi:hypothetical protein